MYPTEISHPPDTVEYWMQSCTRSCGPSWDTGHLLCWRHSHHCDGKELIPYAKAYGNSRGGHKNQMPFTWPRCLCLKDRSSLTSWPNSKAISTLNLALRTLEKKYLKVLDITLNGSLYFDAHLIRTSQNIKRVEILLGRSFLNVEGTNEGVRRNYIGVMRYVTLYEALIST